MKSSSIRDEGLSAPTQQQRMDVMTTVPHTSPRRIKRTRSVNARVNESLYTETYCAENPSKRRCPDDKDITAPDAVDASGDNGSRIKAVSLSVGRLDAIIHVNTSNTNIGRLKRTLRQAELREFCPRDKRTRME